MAEAFASIYDLQARWRPLSDSEEDTATVLLGDASTRIRAVVPGIDAEIAASLMDPNLPKIVVCGMVKRAMISGDNEPGVTNTQETVGPFSRSYTFSNPTGDLYLTKADKQMLGIGLQTAFTVGFTPEVPLV